MKSLRRASTCLRAFAAVAVAISCGSVARAQITFEFEPNDSSAESQALGTVTEFTVSAELLTESDTDYFAFTLAAATTGVLIETSGPVEVDTIIYLLDSSELVIAINDDATGNWSMISGTALAAGSYYVVVAPASVDSGDYYVSMTADGTYNINATTGTGGTITPSGDVAVAVDADQQFTIAAVAGYEINSVAIDDAVLGAVTTHTFTDVRRNREIHATFTYVGQAPEASDSTVTFAEDTASMFVTGDWNFTDPDGGDTLNEVRVMSLPASGQLYQDSTATAPVTPGDIPFTTTSLELSYVPGSDGYGSAYDTFTFQVSDGTYWSGTYTMTIDVTPDNDPPTTVGGLVTVAGNSTYSFDEVDFDFDDIDSPSLQAVRIETTPSAGTLSYLGTPVTVTPLTVAVADLADLTFTPEPGMSGTGYASFTFNVGDGAAFSFAAGTMVIDVTASPAGDSGSGCTPGTGGAPAGLLLAALAAALMRRRTRR